MSALFLMYITPEDGSVKLRAAVNHLFKKKKKNKMCERITKIVFR